MRPSELVLGRSRSVGEVTRLFFDRAVWYFAIHVEEDIENATKEAKNEKARNIAVDRVLREWLQSGQATISKGMFADPAAHVRRG